MSIYDAFAFENPADLRQAPRSDGSKAGNEQSLALHQAIPGLLRKAFIRPEHKGGRDTVFYLLAVPTLEDNPADPKWPNPKPMPPYQASSNIYVSNDTPYGSEVNVPWGLREIPVSRNTAVDDGTISRTVEPGQYNRWPDSGDLKMETRHYLLVISQYKDYEPELAALSLRPKEMKELCVQLSTLLKYEHDLIGKPLHIVKDRGTGVDVEVISDRDVIDTGEYSPVNSDNSPLLNVHIVTSRTAYEDLLLRSGTWTAETEEVTLPNGSTMVVRKNWRMNDGQVIEPDDVVEKPTVEEIIEVAQSANAIEAEVAVEVTDADIPAEELAEMSNVELRELVKARGITGLRSNAKRKDLLSALMNAG